LAGCQRLGRSLPRALGVVSALRLKLHQLRCRHFKQFGDLLLLLGQIGKRLDVNGHRPQALCARLVLGQVLHLCDDLPLSPMQLANFLELGGANLPFRLATDLGGDECLGDGAGNRHQVVHAAAPGPVVDHHVELAGEDQHTDPSQHPLDHGRRDGPEPLAQLEPTGSELQAAGSEDDQSEHLQPVPLDDFVNEHRQTGSRPADLER
jgi:hypothetical protein